MITYIGSILNLYLGTNPETWGGQNVYEDSVLLVSRIEGYQHYTFDRKTIISHLAHFKSMNLDIFIGEEFFRDLNKDIDENYHVERKIWEIVQRNIDAADFMTIINHVARRSNERGIEQGKAEIRTSLKELIGV